jgi:hypothetical protein
MDNLSLVLAGVAVTILIGYQVLKFVKIQKSKGTDAALEDLRKDAYALFLAAEKNEQISQLVGSQKMAWVVANLYSQIPSDMLKTLFSTQTVEQFAQGQFDELYDKIKDLLDDGEVNGSNIEG